MSATVTQLMAGRRSDDVLASITLVFGGVNYGTIPISAPFVRGKPIALYIVPRDDAEPGEILAGPLDCLITDDLALAADVGVVAR